MKDLNPFTSVLVEYNKYFLFNKLQVLNSIYKNVEYEMVRQKYRLADVYHLNSENYDIQIEKIMRDGLVFLPIRRVKKYNGFAHKHEYTDKLDQNSMIYGVVAQDLDIAQLFKELHTNDKKTVDHTKIGEFLGYPECCSNKFEEYFSKSYDPIWEISKATEGSYEKDGKLIVPHYDPFLLQHIRYLGGSRIISWFPCNFLCENSIERSQNWFKVFKEISEESALFVKELLNVKNQVWDLYNSQIIGVIPGYLKFVAASYYNPQKKIVVFDKEE
jgi:hypothetical protein